MTNTLDYQPIWLAEVRMRERTVQGATSLAETVTHNATEELNRHRLRRASDHSSRARALNGLQKALGLQLSTMSDTLRQRYKIKETVKGVVITGVDDSR